MQRSGAIIFTLFVILIVVSAAALAFAIIGGTKTAWSSNSIWTVVLTSLAVAAALALFGYFLATSKTLGKAQDALSRGIKNVNESFDSGAKRFESGARSFDKYFQTQRPEEKAMATNKPFINPNAVPAPKREPVDQLSDANFLNKGCQVWTRPDATQYVYNPTSDDRAWLDDQEGVDRVCK